MNTITQDQQIFKGAENNPFLAPRGVFLRNNMLFVSDTGQNRVFIWKTLPKGIYQEADIVLGQSLKSETGRNAQGNVQASTLQYPSGIWSDGRKLILADAWNHRVLIWNDLPTQDGQAADLVLGQPDFESNQPNVLGIRQPPSAQSLYWCYGVFSDGKSLWVADTGNRRVLYFEEIPQESFAKADAVIGQSDFGERDYEPQQAVWPYSVKINEQGQIAIVDTQYYRVLIWNTWQDALTRKADAIIGQPDFEANGQNQFALFPDAHTLSWCYDVCFYKKGIFVSDTGNSRVLGFAQVPLTNNHLADYLIGQKNFQTGSENPETVQSTENSLYWPFALSIENDLMAIADTGNHRIILKHLNHL